MNQVGKEWICNVVFLRRKYLEMSSKLPKSNSTNDLQINWNKKQKDIKMIKQVKESVE